MSERASRRPLARREILLAAMAAGGAALAGGGWWLLVRRRAPDLDAARELVPAAVEDSAVRIGEAYLAAHPGEEAEALWRGLDERLAPWPEAGLADAGFRDRLRRAVESDFAAESTVAVGGFLLAATTARLCALVALAQRDERP